MSEASPVFRVRVVCVRNAPTPRDAPIRGVIHSLNRLNDPSIAAEEMGDIPALVCAPSGSVRGNRARRLKSFLQATFHLRAGAVDRTAHLRSKPATSGLSHCGFRPIGLRNTMDFMPGFQ